MLANEVVDRAKLLEQLGRCLLADTGDATDIVHAVAHQHLKINDLFRLDAPVFLK